MNATINHATDSEITERNHKLMRALIRLRDLHADMTLLQAQAFLLITQKPGIRQEALYNDLDMADSSASRTLALLSDVGARGFAGLDLIYAKIDPADRRYRLLYLTPKGKRLASDLANILM
jgi:DNA-binding MarR family transcriptional regulator